MLFNVGDWVENDKFGIGQIIEDRGTNFAIRFVTAGNRQLLKTFVTKQSSPPHPGFAFVETKRIKQARTKSTELTYAPTLSFEHLLDRFLGKYPGGFEDAAFDENERQYKEAAVANFSAILNRSELQRLIALGDYGEIAKRARHVASKINLIFPQELMRFNDALKDSEAQMAFSLGLFDVLYGEGSEEEVFERYVVVLGKVGCLKWTIATYFQFLATNGETMFMKPQVSKTLAGSVGVDLNYSSMPRWLTFQKLNETAKIVGRRLENAGVKPRHGIDVQSFMYVAWSLTK